MPIGDWKQPDNTETYGIQIVHEPDDTNPKDRLGIKKPSTWVIPASAILHLGMAMRNGAIKYGAFNWREKKVKASIYYDAMQRHATAWMAGEEYDQVSKVHHLGHLMACAAILIDAETTGNLIDDRPQNDAILDLLAALTEQIEREE